MIEEKTINEELVELSENAVTYLDLLFKSENLNCNEYLEYINNRITKFSIILNLCELEYELPELKNDLKSKYNNLLSYMKSLIEYIESDSIDVYTIDNKVNSIVTSIKQMDNIISCLYNPTFSSLDKLSVRKKVSQYKRELTKISTNAENQEVVIKEKLEELENSAKVEFENIKNKQDNYEKDLEEKMTAVNAKMLDYDKVFEEKNNEISSIKDEYNQKYEEMASESKHKFELLEEEIQKKDAKISELIGLIGNKANIGEYKSNADKAHKERIIWQVLTVIIFFVAFLLMGLITLFTKDYNITTLARYVVSVILLGMSGYTGKQASNQRKDEVYYRKQQLELSSIDIYLDDIPDSVKVEIKKELSDKIFGQAGETYKSKYDDNSNETLDKMNKILTNVIENIKK